VRGFAQAGLGPRDLTQLSLGTPGDALGGSSYWGASVEFQTPLFFAPKDVGIKLAVFADAGSLWDYRGPTSWLQGPGATGEVQIQVDQISPATIALRAISQQLSNSQADKAKPAQASPRQ